MQSDDGLSNYPVSHRITEIKSYFILFLVIITLESVMENIYFLRVQRCSDSEAGAGLSFRERCCSADSSPSVQSCGEIREKATERGRSLAALQRF